MSTRGEETDDASIAAAYWLLALEETPHDADLQARFAAWLAASPEHAAAWADTSDVYDIVGTPAYAAHRAAREAARPSAPVVPLRAVLRSPVRRRPTHRRLAFSAAAVAVAACLALLALPTVLLHWQADHVTSIAERRSVALPDGSTVWLAPDSAIETLAGTDRGVRLLRGEALFEVRPDSTRRFRVVANDVETTVLGTVFNVRLVEDGALVSVREGKVRVDLSSANPPVSERLAVGDWARVDRSGQVALGSLPPSEIAAWQKGQIVARDRSIADVIDEIRRSYGGMILVTDGSLESQRVTGVYNLSDPAAALRAVVGVYGWRVREISPWVMIVSGG